MVPIMNAVGKDAGLNCQDSLHAGSLDKGLAHIGSPGSKDPKFYPSEPAVSYFWA